MDEEAFRGQPEKSSSGQSTLGDSKADIKQKELYGSAFGERSCTMEKPFPAVNR